MEEAGGSGGGGGAGSREWEEEEGKVRKYITRALNTTARCVPSSRGSAPGGRLRRKMREARLTVRCESRAVDPSLHFTPIERYVDVLSSTPIAGVSVSFPSGQLGARPSSEKLTFPNELKTQAAADQLDLLANARALVKLLR